MVCRFPLQVLGTVSNYSGAGVKDHLPTTRRYEVYMYPYKPLHDANIALLNDLCALSVHTTGCEIAASP